MTSKTAKKLTEPIKRSILFVVYPHVKLLDLAGPLQVFADARDDNANTVYETVLVSIDGKSVKTDTPVSIATGAIRSWYDTPFDTLVIVGGSGAIPATQDHAFLNAVKTLEKTASRVASVCTGAFVLAACGLLDGRRAVTHWQSCKKLLQAYPSIQVETDPIFVKDHNIWTSAGVTSGIDMALAMVAEDTSRAAALSLARDLVSYLVRPGGQSQFSTSLGRQTADSAGRFDKLHKWIESNINKDLRVDALAEHMNMSSRNFARLYAKQTGQTPAKAVESMRVQAARRSLEESKISVDEVAHDCGFKDDERMRRSFVRLLKASPSDYRQRFTQLGNNTKA